MICTQTGWRDVTYGYRIGNSHKVVHAGLITVKPDEKPQPPLDAIFFENARTDILRLIQALRNNALPK